MWSVDKTFSFRMNLRERVAGSERKKSDWESDVRPISDQMRSYDGRRVLIGVAMAIITLRQISSPNHFSISNWISKWKFLLNKKINQKIAVWLRNSFNYGNTDFLIHSNLFNMSSFMIFEAELEMRASSEAILISIPLQKILLFHSRKVCWLKPKVKTQCLEKKIQQYFWASFVCS